MQGFKKKSSIANVRNLLLVFIEVLTVICEAVNVLCIQSVPMKKKRILSGFKVLPDVCCMMERSQIRFKCQFFYLMYKTCRIDYSLPNN